MKKGKINLFLLFLFIKTFQFIFYIEEFTTMLYEKCENNGKMKMFNEAKIEKKVFCPYNLEILILDCYYIFRYLLPTRTNYFCIKYFPRFITHSI